MIRAFFIAIEGIQPSGERNFTRVKNVFNLISLKTNLTLILFYLTLMLPNLTSSTKTFKMRIRTANQFENNLFLYWANIFNSYRNKTEFSFCFTIFFLGTFFVCNSTLEATFSLISFPFGSNLFLIVEHFSSWFFAFLTR